MHSVRGRLSVSATEPADERRARAAGRPVAVRPAAARAKLRRLARTSDPAGRPGAGAACPAAPRHRRPTVEERALLRPASGPAAPPVTAGPRRAPVPWHLRAGAPPRADGQADAVAK
ncbi:hypothetical protein GCM10018781_17970 [Kitasatospora indigofera]|uniref:Uncharacterized protein n=1 Tax=Kitasatospora indigofera TaxID=67307 RepID=A0A919FHL6_9ACTN|nr:hypothetical protein GCM10018781_17970 [Kitasatospora indigofera]